MMGCPEKITLQVMILDSALVSFCTLEIQLDMLRRALQGTGVSKYVVISLACHPLFLTRTFTTYAICGEGMGREGPASKISTGQSHS